MAVMIWTGDAGGRSNNAMHQYARMLQLYSLALAALLGVNGFIFAFVRLRWEKIFSVALRS